MLVFPAPATVLIVTQRVDGAVPVALEIFVDHLGFGGQAINISRAQRAGLIKFAQVAVNAIGKTHGVCKVAHSFVLIADTTADNGIRGTGKGATLSFVGAFIVSDAVDVVGLRWSEPARGGC